MWNGRHFCKGADRDSTKLFMEEKTKKLFMEEKTKFAPAQIRLC